jgi:hypothetical protein
MNGAKIFGINAIYIYNNQRTTWSVYVNINTILIQKTNYFNVITGIAQVNYFN